MALLTFKVNDTLVGIVRNHKCGTTTVMSFIAQALWNANPDELQNYANYTKNLGNDHYIGLRQPLDSYYDRLLECDIRVALWRDPIDKFVSGYHHMAKYRMIPDSSLSLFLDNYEERFKNINVWDHANTNTARLGADPGAYTHVVNYKDINTVIKPMIENLTGKTIQIVSARQQDNKQPPSKVDAERIKKIMAEDYINGWC